MRTGPFSKKAPPGAACCANTRGAAATAVAAAPVARILRLIGSIIGISPMGLMCGAASAPLPLLALLRRPCSTARQVAETPTHGGANGSRLGGGGDGFGATA